MKLTRLFSIAILLLSAGCGDDPVPLQTQFHYTTFCDGGGCSTRDLELDGKNGTPIPDLSSATLGIECAIVEGSSATVVTSLKIWDRPISSERPNNGIKIINATIAVGSRMNCLEDTFTLYDDRNEFHGTCGGLADGTCDVLVDEYGSGDGRLVLQMDCQNLVPVAGSTHRSLRDGVLTIQGCGVSEDTR